MLYLIKMKLLQEIVDQFSSVKPPKRKFTNSYTSCSMLLHYGYGFTDPQTIVDVWTVHTLRKMSIVNEFKIYNIWYFQCLVG